MQRHPDLSRRARAFERKLQAIRKETSAYEGQYIAKCTADKTRRAQQNQLRSPAVRSISDTTYRHLLRRKEMIEHERPDTHAKNIT
jgi:hypothetical protein